MLVATVVARVVAKVFAMVVTKAHRKIDYYMHICIYIYFSHQSLDGGFSFSLLVL